MTGGWGTPRYWPEAPKVPDREQIAEQLGVNVEDIPATARLHSISLDPNGLGWIEPAPEPAAADATIEQDELEAPTGTATPPEAPGPQTGAERVEVNPLYAHRGHLYWCAMIIHPGDKGDCGCWM